MSTQKGNAHRSRPQKYQNQFAFKNSLHDTSNKTKIINNLQVANVCQRCKQIIEWKIKYKKYKQPKAPGKCNYCEQKTVKHAYHTICRACAKERNVCPKCGKEAELVVPQVNEQEQLKLDPEIQKMLKTLPERKRRTFVRYMNKHIDEKIDLDQNTKEDQQSTQHVRDDLIIKLKSLMVEKQGSGEEEEEDTDDDDDDDDDENPEYTE